MKTTNFVNLNTTSYDQQFMRESMISRIIQIKPHLIPDHQIPSFQVTSSKIYKADYVSCTIRSQQDFDDLIDHINEIYGGYLIPVIDKINIQKEPEEAAENYEMYLNELLQNRSIRDDVVLFKFLFVQEQEMKEKSKYERFMSSVLELSRKHINQLFTREDRDELIKYDKELEDFREVVAERREKYQEVYQFVKDKCEEYENLNQIFKIFNIHSITNPNIPPNTPAYISSTELSLKNQRIIRIFKQIDGIYHRRLIIKERIKELKADNIRHKYNSMHESTEKVLEKERIKNQLWNEIMFNEVKCAIVIIESLIREVMKNYETMEKLCFSNEEESQSGKLERQNENESEKDERKEKLQKN